VAFSAAIVIFDALSVTITGSFPVIPHSVRAFLKCSARLCPVWLSGMSLVCKTYGTSSHVSLIKWAVMVTYASVVREVQPSHVRATLSALAREALTCALV